MAKRRIPEVIQRIRPNITSTVNVIRSKPIQQSTSNPTTTSNQRSPIQELTVPTRSKITNIEVPTSTRSRQIPSIETNTGTRSKPIQQNIESTTSKPYDRFFSINNPTGVPRSRPQVEAISGSSPRAKVSTNNVQGTNRNGVGSYNNHGIESPEVDESIGSTQYFPPRQPLRFSEL